MSTKVNVKAVKEPSHYNMNGIECMEFVAYLPFQQGSAVKYVWRHRNKGLPEQDLLKALENIERMQEMHITPVRYVEVGDLFEWDRLIDYYYAQTPDALRNHETLDAVLHLLEGNLDEGRRAILRLLKEYA